MKDEIGVRWKLVEERLITDMFIIPFCAFYDL